jgi:MFS family permease
MEKERTFFGLGRNVFFAGLVSFFMDVSSEMVYPLVPLFLANVLGVNKSLIGMIEGIAESTASLLKVFSGWFSDRLGRRKGLMAAGYGISTLSRPMMATASVWQEILSARFVDRLGKGIRTAPRDAIIAESSTHARLARAFSFHRSMDTMGAVVGPAVALLLLGFFNDDYRKVFWLSMIPAIAAVLVVFLFITEKRKAEPDRSARPHLAWRSFDWRVRFFMIIAGLFALGNSSDVFLILKAERTGIPAATVPAVYLMFNLIYSLSAIPAGMAADRFGRKRVILLGFVLFSAVYVGFAKAGSAVAIWVLFGAYGVFMGLTEGIQKAFLASIIPPEFRATAFGVYATVVGLAMFPASFVGGWLWDRFSPSATFYFGSAMATLSAVLFLVFMVVSRKNPLFVHDG